MNRIITPFRQRRLPTRQIDILVVCTGNICRSPYICQRIRDERPEFTVESAGTAAVVGAPIASEVRQLLAARGVDPGDTHRARQISRRMVRSAALIITATRAHRIDVIALDATAAERTFTLKELARVAAATQPANLEELIASARHAAADDSVDHDDDLADPYGLSARDYRLMTDDADKALQILSTCSLD